MIVFDVCDRLEKMADAEIMGFSAVMPLEGDGIYHAGWRCICLHIIVRIFSPGWWHRQCSVHAATTWFQIGSVIEDVLLLGLHNQGGRLMQLS